MHFEKDTSETEVFRFSSTISASAASGRVNCATWSCKGSNARESVHTFTMQRKSILIANSRRHAVQTVSKRELLFRYFEQLKKISDYPLSQATPDNRPKPKHWINPQCMCTHIAMPAWLPINPSLLRNNPRKKESKTRTCT